MTARNLFVKEKGHPCGWPLLFVFCAERVGSMQWLVAGDGLFDAADDFDLRSRGRSYAACGSCLDFAEGDEAGDLGLLEDFLAVELGHALRSRLPELELRIARTNLLFASVLGDAGLLSNVSFAAELTCASFRTRSYLSWLDRGRPSCRRRRSRGGRAPRTTW